MFQFLGTPEQQAVAQSAISRCTFDFSRLNSGLQEQTGRTTIPIEWADLSRYAGNDNIEAHSLYRERVLGLAWYSGKISIEQSLVNDPVLAQEVILAEAAHMVDFFWLNDEQRTSLIKAFHSGQPEDTHEWFDVGPYDTWIGEAWMGAFIVTYSDLSDSMGMMHVASAVDVRAILEPQEEPAPEPNFFRKRNSKVVHDSHRGVRVDISYSTLAEAIADGCRPCKVCKPVEIVED